MTRPRRRIIVSILLTIGLVLATASLRMGWEWKQALDNVDRMIVTPVALPTATLAPRRPQQLASAPATPVPTPAPTAVPAPDDPVNILLLGTDARIGEEVSRTDAIILVHLDPRARRVSMLSLPRDLWVAIPGHGKGRINSAYPLGEQKIGPGYGPALAKETISRLLGIPVHRFVLINFEGFKTLIEKLDGIYVDVPKPIDDPAYPTEDYRTITVHFNAGCQRLNGDRALIYSRTRHADSDFGRNQRQQQVLMAIFERVSEQQLLTQLTSLDDYTEALRDYVRTDLSRGEMLSLARMGVDLGREDIERYSIGSEMLIALKKPATFTVAPAALRQLVTQLLGAGAPPGEITQPILPDAPQQTVWRCSSATASQAAQ